MVTEGISMVSWKKGGRKDGLQGGHEETLGGNNVLHLDCSRGFCGCILYQKILNCPI